MCLLCGGEEDAEAESVRVSCPLCFQGLILENVLDAEALSPALSSPKCGVTAAATARRSWQEEEEKVSDTAEQSRFLLGLVIFADPTRHFPFNSHLAFVGVSRWVAELSGGLVRGDLSPERTAPPFAQNCEPSFAESLRPRVPFKPEAEALDLRCRFLPAIQTSRLLA